MKRKLIKLITTSLLLSFLFSINSLASWEQQSDGAWKYKDDTTGVYVTSQWIESATESGVWYYVEQTGIMATNTMIDNQYYVNELGEWRESSSSNVSTPVDNSISNGGSQSDNSDISWGNPNEKGGNSGGFRPGTKVAG